MSKWEDNVRKVEPYVPGEQPNDTNIIKLNTNENPYPPSPMVMKAMQEVTEEGLRKYPDPTCSALIDALADYHKVNSANVFVGVGSDDVIATAFMTFFHSDKKILFPDISYSFYPVWASMMEIPFEKVPLADDFTISPEDYKKENGGIIFPNPNAPTAMLLEKGSIREILDANPDSAVIVDEAYVDFSGEDASVLDLIPEYENLLVTRTFSKSRSLAGLRIGYAIGNEKVIKYMSDVKYSYNSYTMNETSLKLGVESVKDDAYFKKTCDAIVNTRENFTKELLKLGFNVLPSKANFVFAGTDKMPASEIFAKARENHIFFRYFAQNRIDNFLRITIGTDEDMERVVRFLKDLLA